MAAGVLIAILILSALVIMWRNTSGLFNTKRSVNASEQVQIFNKDYEAFNKKLLRGTEVISAINKVENNNRSHAKRNIPTSRAIREDEMQDPGYYMRVEFEMKEAVVYTKEDGQGKKTSKKFEIGKTYSMNDFFLYIKTDNDAFTDFKRRVFDCVEMKYNATTGRVNYMKFIERKMTENEYVQGI